MACPSSPLQGDFAITIEHAIQDSPSRPLLKPALVAGSRTKLVVSACPSLHYLVPKIGFGMHRQGDEGAKPLPDVPRILCCTIFPLEVFCSVQQELGMLPLSAIARWDGTKWNWKQCLRVADDL
jgi:hypothetical protein